MTKRSTWMRMKYFAEGASAGFDEFEIGGGSSMNDITLCNFGDYCNDGPPRARARSKTLAWKACVRFGSQMTK